jgi:hypothetical protein
MLVDLIKAIHLNDLYAADTKGNLIINNQTLSIDFMTELLSSSPTIGGLEL